MSESTSHNTYLQISGNTTVDVKPVNLPLRHSVWPRSRSVPAREMLEPQHNLPFGVSPFPGFFPMPYGPMQGWPHPAGMTAGLGKPDPSSIETIKWFEMLDSHGGCNADGIIFAPFGPILREKDFFRISQLTSDFVTIQDLQDWLGIRAGTAGLILQYAKEDMERYNAGISLQ
jgi:hypothetical protein